MVNNSEREASPLKRADTIRLTVEEREAWRKAAGLHIDPETAEDYQQLSPPGRETTMIKRRKSR